MTFVLFVSFYEMVHPFTLLQDEWVMLAPLGDHPHVLGIQRITPAAIANMASRFNGLLGKLGRLFGGAPTFEGHHDVEPEKYPNSKSYGWIMSLDARADGLWGRMTWTPEGRDMLQNGAFKFVSPVFIGKPIGQQNGQTIFEPVMFKSLALTNEPNLPLPPLANTKLLSTQHFQLSTFLTPPLANNKDHMETITSILDLPNEASADQILGAVRILKNSALSTQHSELKAALTLAADATADQILEAARALNDRAASLQDQLSAQHSELSTLKNTQTSALSNTQAELAQANERATSLQTKLITAILDNAIRESRITLAQRAEWKTKLESDLAAAEAQLAKQQPILNTTSLTRELGNEKGAYETEATRRAALIGYISEQQAKGLTYDEAWARAKAERATLFEQMVRK